MYMDGRMRLFIHAWMKMIISSKLVTKVFLYSINLDNKSSPGGECCGGGVFQTLILGFDPRWIGIAYDDEGSFFTVMFSVKTWQEDATIARKHVWSERLEQTLGLENTFDKTVQIY